MTPKKEQDILNRIRALESPEATDALLPFAREALTMLQHLSRHELLMFALTSASCALVLSEAPLADIVGENIKNGRLLVQRLFEERN